ncbi:alpha/beta hydrolase [Salisediminibacterium halotolerans]|uniref:alpha/beta hydrolase n=1 Tax=Salisediminibacterium halotolerans TaxID=517425 RepID=UPI000EB39C28|nr:alpha/beta hydrolase [Salisediminibacterium halotolerans]RLJ78269.1 lysophospholipase [Actinophytocola xinjiangensis]RPE88392.1 lysophospholipase [Salisediminibacterium halotolerans]TWG37246.1 lysophospholipase [Salisediminibacterium halotolerans]GEL07726.1 monoacylglycerol lipase [Salisediminibacterium halotolerans]
MAEERMIKSFDGLKLFGKKDEAAEPKRVVVIVHGLAEHLGRYEPLTAELTQSRATVYRYDQRGHARSEGKRVFIEDYNELINDLLVQVELAKSENPGLPVYVIGHSMGGYTAAVFGTKYPGTVNGFVLSGALTRYNQPIFGELPLPYEADTYLPNELGDGVCSDPAVIEDYMNDPNVEKEISVGLINALAPGVELLTGEPQRFTDPVLVLHGNDDGLVSEKDSRDFFGEVASKDKTLKIYSGLMHEIFNEVSKQDVYDDVIAWLNKQE